MLAFIPFALLLITPILMAGMQLLKAKFSYFWLVSLLTGFLAWILIFLLRLLLPIQLSLPPWGPAEFFPTSPAFNFDLSAWSVMLAVGTLLFSAILTDTVWVANLEGRSSDWIYWAFGMILSAFCLLAIASNNLLALTLTWAALDIAELVIYLAVSKNPGINERIVIGYSARIGSLLLVILSTAISFSTDNPGNLSELPPLANLFLLLATGLRLGVLPFNTPFPKNLFSRRGIKVLIQLLPIAPCLIVLVRVANNGLTPPVVAWLLLFTGISAVYVSAFWAASRDKQITSSFWAIGMGGVILASAIQAQPEATLAWGVSLLLSGGLISLYTLHSRLLVPLLYVGLVTFTSLPFTPTWWGVLTFTPPWSFALFLILVTHALLVAGYLRRIARRRRVSHPSQGWVWLNYSIGLIILPATQFIIPIWNVMASPEQSSFPPWTQAWIGLASISIAAIFLLIPWRKLGFLSPLSRALQEVLSLAWLYRLLWRIYHAIRRATSLVSDILEGPSGILWTLLLLTLVVSLLAQIRSGR